MPNVFTHTDDTWCHVAVVTDSELIAATVKKQFGPAVQQAIEAGTPPREAVHAQTSAGQREVVAPLSSIESVSWVDSQEDNDVRVRFQDNQKSRSVTTRLSGPEVRERFVELLCRNAASVSKSEETTSIWYVAFGPLFFSVFAVVFTGLVVMTGWDGPVNVDEFATGRRAGLKGLIATISNTLGVGGALAVGGAFVTAMLIWWMLACRNRPTRQAISFQRTSSASV
jgi:hypothetical protein